MQSVKREPGYAPIFVLLFAIVLLYALFPTRTHYWDGVLFSLYIEGVQHGVLPAGILFHPNHLLYSGLGYGFYKLILTFGFSIRGLTALQILNIALSAATACVLFRFAKRLTRSSLIALSCAVLLAFGATWWRFSTDANSYVIAVFFLLLAVRFVLGEPQRLVAAAGAHTAAMLFHELAVFAYVPVIVAIALSDRPAAKRVWICCAYVLSTAACTALIYFAAYQYSDHAAYPNLLSWVMSRSTVSQTTHGWKQFPAGYLLSYGKLFVGGKLSLIRDFFSIAEAVAFAVCAACIGFAIYLFRHPVNENPNVVDVRALPVLWAWLVPYAIFFAWWEPASAFYKLFIWPPILLLGGIYLARNDSMRRRARGVFALTVGIAAWNFGAFAFPHSHSGADPVLMLARQIDRGLPKNATVYYQVFDPDDWYLEYFAPGRRWVKLPEDFGTRSTLQKTELGPVCLETTALDQIEKGSGLKLAIDPARRWDLVNRQHHIRFECLK